MNQFVDNADPVTRRPRDPGRPGSAWGHDSRQVTISPVPRPAPRKFTVPERRNYRVDVQIPILTNLPASVTWTLSPSEATELASASFPEGTLSLGWVRLFELELGAAGRVAPCRRRPGIPPVSHGWLWRM